MSTNAADIDISDLLGGEAGEGGGEGPVEHAETPVVAPITAGPTATGDHQLDNLQQQAEDRHIHALIEADASRPGVLVYDLETVPDESRFPPPVESVPAGLTGDPAAILTGTIGDINAHLRHATDDQLLHIYSAENERDKPRKGVLESIEKLRSDRQSGFEKWLKEHSVGTFTCRICCFGWSVGDGEVRSMTARTDDEERSILEAFWRLVGEDRVRVGFGITRFDDMVIINRSLALGVDAVRRLDLRKYGNREAKDLEQIIFPGGQQIQKCKTIARAWGIKIPVPDVDGSKVYDLYINGAMSRIAEYCRSDVTVEREMFRIASRMFA